MARLHGWIYLSWRSYLGRGASGHYGGAFDRTTKETEHVTFADVCIAIMAMFAFATLILKVVEVSRSK